MSVWMGGKTINVFARDVASPQTSNQSFPTFNDLWGKGIQK